MLQCPSPSLSVPGVLLVRFLMGGTPDLRMRESGLRREAGDSSQFSQSDQRHRPGRSCHTPGLSRGTDRGAIGLEQQAGYRVTAAPSFKIKLILQYNNMTLHPSPCMIGMKRREMSQ